MSIIELDLIKIDKLNVKEGEFKDLQLNQTYLIVDGKPVANTS